MKIFRKGTQSTDEIREWLLELRENAYVPESGFAVSVVFRARFGAADDYYFGGVNVENVDHRLSTHGEEGAIAAMVTGLGKGAEIVEAWLMSAPQGAQPGAPAGDIFPSCCGKCRQQIAGVAHQAAKIHYLSLNGKEQKTTVAAFLPEVFTFRHFIPDFAPAAQTGDEPDIEHNIAHRGPLSEKEIIAWLHVLAPVDYATKVSQSVVLELDNGFFVAGTRVEEAAYIDISAVQSALAVAAAAFGGFEVRGAWVYTKGREEKVLPAGTVSPLPLSSLQALKEFADDVPLYYVGEKSVAKSTLEQAVKLAPATRRRYQKI